MRQKKCTKMKVGRPRQEVAGAALWCRGRLSIEGELTEQRANLARNPRSSSSILDGSTNIAMDCETGGGRER